MLKNLSFINGMVPFRVIQAFLSMATAGAIYIMTSTVLRNPAAINPYDYFDVFF